ncbi:MAG TPA: two-component regulator propeller domain-containing protein [Verrucomicrobiae bacterium]|nr:two-component regulator propeller domain-containing protein [Verrucomicrobiae bacterium]
MRRLLFLIVSLVGTACCLDPHKPITQYVHTVWHSEDGLPQNSIQALLQTKDGYLWIGTQEGLVRFNGIEFKVFNKSNTDAIRHNDVRELYQDREGILWIGTFGGGLVRYKDGQFTDYTVQRGLSNNTVTSILQDTHGNLWVGTMNGLNELVAGQSTNFIQKTGLSDNTVQAIAEDADGRLVVATHTGLDVVIDGKPMGAYSKLVTNKLVVKALFRDRHGILWVGTENHGLDALNAGSLTHYGATEGLPNAPIHTIYQDDKDTIWVGTEGGGVCRLVSNKFDCYSSKDGLSGAFVESIIQDHEGSLWVGTETGGVNCFKEGALTNYGSEMGLRGSPRALFEGPDGSLWIGTSIGLFRMKDYKVTPYLTNKGPANNYVYSMFQDHLGNVWVGTDEGGLNKFTGHTVTNYTKSDGLPDNWIPAVYEDRAGDIWMGTFSGGVSRLHNGRFINYTTGEGLGSNRVWAIHQDYLGNLWFGTDAGLSLFRDGKFINFDLQEASPNGTEMGTGIMLIHEDSDRVLWAGTYGGGLKRFKDGKFTSITARQGLFDDTIWSLLEDDLGYFWMSSNRGIFRVKKSDLVDFADRKITKVVSQSYGVADGMESAECNGGTQYSGWKTRDGKLLFACLKSVVVVDPNHLPINRLVPQVAIESVKINQQEEDVASGATISGGADVLEFHYASLSYFAPKRVRFRCKLEGFDEWSFPTTPGFVRYTNVPPGRYTFRVQASNNDDVWNLQGASFSFYLEPRFYETKWFGPLCALVLLLFSMAVYLFRIQQVRKREKELVVLVASRTCELRAAKELAEAATRAKSDFLANMSHEIRTPLNGVTGMLELVEQSELSPDQKQLVTMAQDSANTLMVVINDILDFSRIEAGKLAFDVREFDLTETVAEAIRTMALRAHQKGLELAYQVDPVIPRSLLGDEHRLKQVLINLIGNAIKFTEKGEVVLRVIAEDSAKGEAGLRFAVSDTGIGIPAEKQQLIFEAFSQADASTTRKYGGSGLGLAISSRIVALMDGRMWVDSTPGQGSTFYFTARLQVAAVSLVSEDTTKADLIGIRVLVVDDNASNRAIVEDALRNWGLKVSNAGSGPDALRELHKAVGQGRPYQLVVADSRMPGMDGFDFIEAMKQSPGISAAAIMMLTSDDYNSSIRRCRQLGITTHLLKPVTLAELLVVIRQTVSSITVHVKPLYPVEKYASRRFRILLAEDNLVNQRLAVRTLEKMGHEVVVAQTGQEVLDALRMKKFDLVLMDVQMPEMDGYAATREIRKSEQGGHGHMPVIAMTAHAMKGDRESCLDSGMDDYIAKPINREELQQVIERVMKARREAVDAQPSAFD